ncbi:predicted protein [Nematostella vectensis]|uniref:EF-hand domain-containing protein n=1 Tax=Nematostella vectensis TaxID=45351 RepID=A7S8V5_NEMVE|nr:predicted protein [Nematostella vectensis]|eukprot:XP_001631957.1 predicted protein [Nematostella vectensis]
MEFEKDSSFDELRITPSPDRPRALSAADVFEKSMELNGIKSPVIRNLSRNIMRKWREAHERKVNKRLQELRIEKKRKDGEAKEIARLVTRKIPLDVLAKDWLYDNELTADARVYLVENLLPTLILGVEKLLDEVTKRGLTDSEGFCPDFNPINYLAQYLMRNNLKYSNFVEASPYTKGLHKVTEDLKKEIFSSEENKLAKMKEEAKQRRIVREKEEKAREMEERRRAMALEEQFVEWTSDWKGFLPLAAVQNMLMSFQEFSSKLSEDLRKEYCIPLGPTDTTGRVIDLDGFKEYLAPYGGNMTSPAFNAFLVHMASCAKEYRAATIRQAMRNVLQNLFLVCDVNRAGHLDRQRVLELLGLFYDGAQAADRDVLRNPRQWPVIEIEETSDEESVFEEEKPKGDIEPQKEISQEKAPAKPEAQQTNTAEITPAPSDESQDAQQEAPVYENAKAEEQAESETVQQEATKTEEEVTKPEEEANKPDEEASTTVSAILRPEKEIEGSAFDENTLNQAQFLALIEKFLGDEPKKHILEKFVRFTRANYVEFDFDRLNRMNKARLDARSAKRRRLVDQLFDLWDIDGSGSLELDKIQVVLNKWKVDNVENGYKEVLNNILILMGFFSAVRIFGEVTKNLNRQEFRDIIDAVYATLPDEEEAFEALITFLVSSVERSFEERRRSETRKRWLTNIDVAAQTSGAQLDPVYQATFQVLYKDAEEHGRGKMVSSFVSMLETNDDPEALHRGEAVLRYAACTAEDIGYMLGKVIYRDMKAVSWAAVDSGKPIHVPKVGSHGGVYFWNSFRNKDTDGSLIVLPLKDHEKRVIGLLGVDTLNDSHKTPFITHEISFYQAAAKALSQAIQFVDIRRKTLRVAESAVSWILRRSQNVQNVNVYLVEPGLRPSDGLVLRRMILLSHNGVSERFNNPPRLDRKDNLFRDYLFKCVESSETITADAYGERHMAFPLRDAEGHAVAVVDISIGDLKALPPHENREIQRMLRLLAMAHREVAREVAGLEKNIVLEVEKEYEDSRIDVLFDRLMLLDLRENVGRLDSRAFAEIKSYKDPPKVIHDILRAVLGIFNTNPELQARFEEWTTCKQYVNQDLVKNITAYDPTARSNETGFKVDAKGLAKTLQNVPQGAVAKHGSLPAQYLFNWAFVCLSLIEHTEKMAEARPGKALSPPAASSLMIDPGNGRLDSPSETINTNTRTETTS